MTSASARKFAFGLGLTSLLLTQSPAMRAAELLADVVVYGSTPAGVCAAVAAAREGASVILLAPDQHLGGMLTSGLCTTEPHPFREGTLAGLAWEWHWRVERDYRKRDIDPGYRVEDRAGLVPWSYEPHVALRMTRQMLDDAGVLLLVGRRLEAAALDGPRLLRLHTREGDFKAKVFIDASYEGDLAAMCGVRFLTEVETLPDQTFGPPPPLSPESASEALPFILCLTDNQSARVPLPRPSPTTDPLWLEDFRQWLSAHPDTKPVWQEQTLPNRKIAVRFELTGPLAGFFARRGLWCQSEDRARAQTWEDLRQRALVLCHFLATDPAVSEAWRQRWSALGLARDEFTGNAHWPPLLPLRAGRRVHSNLVLSEADALAGVGKDEAIALCPFPLAEEVEHSAWPVPLRALLPAMEECENLLVPTAPSCSPAVGAALWHEPMLMTLGQSAGIAAALASRDEEVLPLLALDRAALQARLAAQGVVLSPPPRKRLADLPPPDKPAVSLPGLVLDDSDAELMGPWRFSSHLKPHHGKGYHHDGRQCDSDCQAIFRFQVTESARYEVWIAYTADQNRASNVPVTIETGGRKARLAFDQTQPPQERAPFRRLAEVILKAGESVTLTLGNKGADGYVVVDGLQVVKVDAPSETGQ